MSVQITHASIDENKNVRGGHAGDQTGKEVCSRPWYNKPWNCVIRLKDESMAKKLSKGMIRAAKNDCIGYDQNQRNTLINRARINGYDPGLVKVDVETDCSALVVCCLCYAGVPERGLMHSGNSSTTSTLRKDLLATGLVTVFTDRDHTQKTGLLRVGDILLSEGHHVAVVTDVETKKENTKKKTAEEIAFEVIDGKWGNGISRKNRLEEAGYNYREIQRIVNQILRV